MGKQLVPYVKSCCRLLRDHYLLTLSICFLALLYKSFPFLFYLLIRSSPVLFGTAILLGFLLSYGELELEAESAYARRQSEEEDCHGDSSLKAYDLVAEAPSETTFVSQSLREYVPIKNQDDNPLLEVLKGGEDSDTESTVREAPRQNATTENIDELHPLLQSDLIHTQVEEEEETSEVSEDHEDEEEEANKEEDESNSAIKWTADDEKNLMDLGYLELERNQRLETLLLRRIARSTIKSNERNLIDFDGTDSLHFPSIVTKRQNPFDLPVDLMDEAPGSAPSVLRPRNNPFDHFNKQSAEVPASQTMYSRHASFHVGSSFWEFPRHFAPETFNVKEDDPEIHDEHEVEEYPSNLVKHGSISSEDGDLQKAKESSVSETSSRSVPIADIQEFDKPIDETFEDSPTTKKNIFSDEQQTSLEDHNFQVPETSSRFRSRSRSRSESVNYMGYQELSTNMLEEMQMETDVHFPVTSRSSCSYKGNEEVGELLFVEQQSGVTIDGERQNMYSRSASETSSRSRSDSEKEEEYSFEDQQSSAAIDHGWHKDSGPVSETSSSSSSDSETQEVKDCLVISMDYESQNKSCDPGTMSCSGSDTENEKHCCEEQSSGMDHQTLNNDNIYVPGTSSYPVPDIGNEEEKHCVVEVQSRVAMDYRPGLKDDFNISGTSSSPVSDTDTHTGDVEVPDMQNPEVDEFDKTVDYESPNYSITGIPSSSVSVTENLEVEELNTNIMEESVAVDDGPQIKDPVYDSSPSSEAPEVSLSVDLEVHDDVKVKDVCHVGTMRLEDIQE